MVGEDQHRLADDGFSLVETVVAMTIFAVVAVISASLLLGTFQVTRGNTQRVVAANLASQQIEEARSRRALDIPDGATASTATVSGTQYDIVQTANYLPSDSASSVCTGTGNQLAYKLVTVVVTWPNMGSTKPVREDTLRALGIGGDGVDPTRGSAAVLVKGADGQPRSGVTVTLQPGGTTRLTGVDGCAFYGGLDPAVIHSASASQSGLVGIDGAQLQAVASIGIQASKVTRALLTYDTAGSLAVTPQGPAGYPAVAGLSLTLTSELFSPVPDKPFLDCAVRPDAPRQCVSGSPRTATALYPGLYGVWAGTCPDAQVAGDLVPVLPGGSSAATVPLAGVDVEVTDALGDPLLNRTVYARATTAGCDEEYSFSGGGPGPTPVSLPQGSWQLSLTPGGSGPTVVLDVAGPAPLVVVTG